MVPQGTNVFIDTPSGTTPSQHVHADRFFLSKTVVFNTLMTLVGICELADLVNVLPSQYDGAPIMVVGIINVILRVWFTKAPVTS